ncbi:pentapeptide repeat-containing protein [Primorskyibacter sp. S187A]|uniref:pentapeptide repeat-containing protein n=1 Tax=Primorskyibacter sp. S187A TaxID=3415130 RepID=UPI003C7A6211
MLDTYLSIVSHPALWLFLGGTLLFFVIQSIVAATPKKEDAANPAKGLQSETWVIIFVLCLAPFWAYLFARTFWATWNVSVLMFELIASDAPTRGENLRWFILGYVGLITALGGLIAAPLALARLWFTSRQTDAQEQGLVTDRINSAVEALGAQKEVNRLGRTIVFQDGDKIKGDFEWYDERTDKRKDGHDIIAEHTTPWQNIALTEPNLEVRIGGLLSLERLMKDNPEHHVMIMEILTAYIRENASGVVPGNMPEDDASHSKWERWRSSNPAKSMRLDIDTCLSIIERRVVPEEYKNYVPSLERAPLAHLDLSNRKLKGLNLLRAQLQGADLTLTELMKAQLYKAEMQGCCLQNAKMQKANLVLAKINGANCTAAKLNHAELGFADVRGAELIRAELIGTQSTRLKAEGAYFDGATLRGSTLASAEFDGASLVSTDLNGALLTNTRFGVSAYFHNTSFRGALLYGVIFGKPMQKIIDPDQVFVVGDEASLDHAARPDHWIEVPEDWNDAFRLWRDWIIEQQRTRPKEEGWDEVPLPKVDG